MKNNRAIRIDDQFVDQHELSTDPPPQDSLFWKLWNDSHSIANKALHADFIQGIKSGTLDPVQYGAFNVNDAYYCFHGAEDYQTALQRATHPVLKEFLTKKYHSYQKYNQSFSETWHIKDASGIVPEEICKEYSSFESEVALQEDPIYLLIVMLLCEYLWAWIGEQSSPPTVSNLYAPWIKNNNNPKGAYAMGNFLEEYQQEYMIDQSLAMKLYSTAMNYEYLNFREAYTAHL